MIFPILAGLAGISLMGNPPRRRRKARRKNPVSIPKDYKSAAGTRLGHDLKHGLPPIRSLKVAQLVARNGGDHIALGVLKSALVAASANRSMPQAVAIARKTARLLGAAGSTGVWKDGIWRQRASKPRTTKDEYIVQGNYGYGWDDETTEDNRKDARQRLKEYRANGSGSYRLIKRRVKLTNPKRRHSKRRR